MSFQYVDGRVILKVNNDLIVQCILVPIFEPPLNGTYFFDIFQPIRFNVAHAKNICLV